MASTFLLSAVVILSCVSESWQRCFSYHCPHHSPLTECVQGTWLCQKDEFCQTTTHLSHGNSPWVITECRPAHDVRDCWRTQAGNEALCDPNKHDRVCQWCCIDEQCMKDLTNGIFPTPAGTMAPTTMAGAAATTTAAAVTTVDSGTTATAQPASTTAAGFVCEDLYLGDCTADYGGRCGEPLIAQLCARTCNACFQAFI